MRAATQHLILILLFTLVGSSSDAKDVIPSSISWGLGVVPHYDSGTISNFNSLPAVRYDEGFIISGRGTYRLVGPLRFLFGINGMLQVFKSQYNFQREGEVRTQLRDIDGVRWDLTIDLGLRTRIYNLLTIGVGGSFGRPQFNLSYSDAREANGGPIDGFKGWTEVYEYSWYYEAGFGFSIFGNYFMALGRLTHYNTDGIDIFGGVKELGIRPTLQIIYEIEPKGPRRR